MKGLKQLALLIVSCALVATLNSCGKADGRSRGPDAISPSAVKIEYQTEQVSLALAPGWSWPTDPTPMSVTSDGSKVVYQPGYGLTAADQYWYCSWESALSMARGAAQQQLALSNMLEVKQTHYYVHDILPPDRVAFDKILADAGLGDLTAVEFDVKNNCPQKS